MTDERKIEIAELEQVMRTESGRNVMRRLLSITGIDEETFDDDTHKHARNAGRREVGLWLRNQLKMAGLDNYFRMIKENEDG